MTAARLFTGRPQRVQAHDEGDRGQNGSKEHEAVGKLQLVQSTDFGVHRVCQLAAEYQQRQGDDGKAPRVQSGFRIWCCHARKQGEQCQSYRQHWERKLRAGPEQAVAQVGKQREHETAVPVEVGQPARGRNEIELRNGRIQKESR